MEPTPAYAIIQALAQAPAVDLSTLILGGLASTIATLAAIIYQGQRKEIVALRKENRELAGIVLAEAAKESETVAQFARLWAKHGGDES